MNTRLKTRNVADACGCKTRVVHNYAVRGIVEFSGGDHKGRSQGDHHLFSFKTAVRLRIITDLVRAGFSPSRAAIAARAYNENCTGSLLCAAPDGAVVIEPRGTLGDTRLEAARLLASRVRGFKPTDPIILLDIAPAVSAVKAVVEFVERNPND